MIAWPPARIDELRRLLYAGQKYSEIGARMGITRGQVAGVVRRYRLGVPKDAHRPPPAITPNDTGTLAIMKLRAGRCCWPSGDPRDLTTFRYCLAPCEVERSYCDKHKAIAYHCRPARRVR